MLTSPVDRAQRLVHVRDRHRCRRRGCVGAVQAVADIAVHEGAASDRLSRAGLPRIPARVLPAISSPTRLEEARFRR